MKRWFRAPINGPKGAIKPLCDAMGLLQLLGLFFLWLWLVDEVAMF